MGKLLKLIDNGDGTFSVAASTERSVLPSGAATSAKQDDIIGYVDDLESKIGEVADLPTANTIMDRLKAIATNTANIKVDADTINVNTDELESLLTTLSAKDFATQATLAQIKSILDTDGIKKIIDPLPVGSNLIGKIDVDSSALPSGAATEAKQDDIITALGLQATVAKQDDIITALAGISQESKQDDIITALAGISQESKQDDIITALGLQATVAKQDDIITALAGKATEAKQDDIITALAGISQESKQDDIITALAGISQESKQDDIITALGLQATAAKQDDIITALGLQATVAKQDDIITALGLQATAAKQDDIITAMGLQATAAKQDDIVAALTGKATEATLEAVRAALVAGGLPSSTLETTHHDASTANGTGTVANVTGYGPIAFQAVGTWDGATVTYKGSVDGTNYVALPGTSAVTADGIFQPVDPGVAGYKSVRAEITDAGATTSLTVKSLAIAVAKPTSADVVAVGKNAEGVSCYSTLVLICLYSLLEY